MKYTVSLVLISLLFSVACREKSDNKPQTVQSTMDDVVTRLYSSLSAEQLDTIGNSYILEFLDEDEKEVLSTKFLYFTVNVPVKVSLMRHLDQTIPPFWLESSGFVKTDLSVKNYHNTYEVWQKDFGAGKVELGINGFDQHRPVFFICVGPKNPQDVLEISQEFPDNQHFEEMGIGAFTYHDWDELTLEEVPEELKGQVLFTTIRGRAREAHLVGAFRKTPYPSTNQPDQVLLTWSDDPTSTIDIQWRTNSSVSKGGVKFWMAGSNDTLVGKAEKLLMEDRLLQNDRYIYRYTAKLENLKSGSLYQYQVGADEGLWTDVATFKTETVNDDSFSFIWFGDTHKSPKWGNLLQESYQKYPDVAFYSIAGDLVGTGLFRDEWDKFFHNSGPVFNFKPLMPTPGNHDNQDGLGAWMYAELFSLPENGPQKVLPEMTYSFTYKNALFLMIDATAPYSYQSEWIENQLQNTNAEWKFAMFHFPPYNYEEDYSDIRERWCSLFDTYHVDMVMSGHTHYYMRSKPIFNEQVVDHPSKGTIYIISVGIPGNHGDIPPQDYAEVQDGKGWLYQHVKIENNKLIYKSINIDGKIKDELVIEK
ncbi:MAG: metallophosphoesterase family protein [Bacteroidales bacterium]|nr:metallophosphoesterase family protein [Bacteroidales bacterium]